MSLNLSHIAPERLELTASLLTESYGPYQPALVLGCGATSAVLRAHHGAGRAVALKVALTHKHGASLQREYDLLRRLAAHPHAGVVTVYEAGESGKGPWFAMEELPLDALCVYVRTWLGATTERGPEQALLATLRLMHSLALALTHVHAHGVCHGDINPSNVLVRSDGEPVLIDFGAAEFTPRGSSVQEFAARLPGMGTLGYCAPERLLGEGWDTRADIYSLGCVFYELLAARPVFVSDTDEGLRAQHEQAVPTPPSKWLRGVPAALDRLVLSMLEKRPRSRMARASQVAGVLRELVGLAPAPTVATDTVLFEPRLVGRDEVHNAIAAAITDVSASSRAHVLIAAPSGSGKTRLLSELSRTARRKGWTVLDLHRAHGTMLSHGSSLPVLAIVRQVSSLLRAEPSLIARHAAELRPLCEVDGEVASLLGEHDALPRVRDEEARVRLWRALSSALELLSEGRPLLLVIDDLQSADGLTRQFLRWVLLQDALRFPLRILASLDENRLADPEFHAAEASWFRFGLAPVSRRDVAHMLEDMLAVETIAPDFLNVVSSSSGGLPLDIAECVQELVASGSVRVENGHATLKDTPVAVFGASTGAHARLLRRVAAEATQVGAVAAVLGRVFSTSELQALLRSTDLVVSDVVSDALNELLTEGIVSQVGGDVWAFAHERVRRELEASLSEEHAVRVHRAAAEVVSRAHSSADDVRIGLHLARGGESERAAVVLRRAARQSSHLTLDDAIALLKRACTEADKVPLRSATIVRMGLQLMRLYCRAARHDELEPLSSRLLADARSTALQRAQVHGITALSLRIRGDYPAANGHLDAAERELVSIRSTSLARQREWLEQSALRLALHYVHRDVSACFRRLRATLPQVRRWGTGAQKAAMYMAAANAIALKRRYAYSSRAVAYQRRALAIYLEGRYTEHQIAMAMFEVAFMLLIGGPLEHQEARAVLEQAAVRAARAEDAVVRCRVTTYRAIVALRLGSAADCEKFAEAALREASECGLKGYVGVAHGCLAWVFLWRDERHLVRQHVAEARRAWWRLERTAENRRAEYPLQWLAHFPLLALIHAEEDYAACKAVVLELLHESQAQLAKPLRHALRAVMNVSDDDPSACARAVEACLRLAVSHRYF